MKKLIIIQSFIDHPPLTEDCMIVASPDMVSNYGLDYYVGGWHQVANKYPEFLVGLAIPCGDDVGLAMRAIKSSVTAIYFKGDSPVFEKVVSMAEKAGVSIYPQEELYD